MSNTSLPRWLLAGALAFFSGCAFTPLTPDMPHLEKRDGMTKLIVDGRPFICVAGELANSSSSDVQTMKAVWPRLAKANLNTILTVVSWDLIEPVEGKFDFSMIDYQIEAARANHVRLIFLWMASWKNGLSHFPPPWVKADQARFPRVVNEQGKTLEILSTLSPNNRDADARAFAAVLKHIGQVDTTHAVIGFQVENEVGVLGSSRDFCPAANAAFAGQVPAELLNYLQQHKDNLLPELKQVWNKAGNKTSGTWEEVFGKNVPRPAGFLPVPNPGNSRPDRPAGMELATHADEIFMAWNYSQYIGRVAAEGKKEYPLPMYCNAWIVQPKDRGPGDYPSGGPEPFVHDIWRAGAPAIDILAPDIYLDDYAGIIRNFARSGNPAFNPETRQDSAKCWTAFTELNALCYSPFGVDNLDPASGFARTYGLVNALSGALAEAQGKPDSVKVISLTQGRNPGKVTMGNYVFDFSVAPPPRRAGAAAAPVTRPAGDLPFMDAPYIVIIRTAPDEFYFATNGDYPFTASAAVPGTNITAPNTIDRGYFNNGQWHLVHRLNGDDIMGLGYDLSAAAGNNQAGTLVPLGRERGAAGGDNPTIMCVNFYHYH